MAPPKFALLFSKLQLLKLAVLLFTSAPSYALFSLKLQLTKLRIAYSSLAIAAPILAELPFSFANLSLNSHLYISTSP